MVSGSGHKGVFNNAIMLPRPHGAVVMFSVRNDNLQLLHVTQAWHRLGSWPQSSCVFLVTNGIQGTGETDGFEQKCPCGPSKPFVV